jgi:hypothetical protein
VARCDEQGLVGLVAALPPERKAAKRQDAKNGK